MASGSSDLSMYWEWGRWPPQRNRSSHYQEIHRTPTIDILADLVFMTISRDCEVYVKCFSELASHEDKLSRKMLLCWIATCSAVRQNKGHGMGLRLSQDHLGFCWHWVHSTSFIYEPLDIGRQWYRAKSSSCFHANCIAGKEAENNYMNK